MKKKVLKPFQKWILKELAKYSHGGLFLNMGLGKTVISCHYIVAKKFKYTLVVCPKIIIDQWKNEVELTDPSYDIVVIESRTAKNLESYLKQLLNKEIKDDCNTVFITNYEFINARQKLFILLARILDSVILDESNYIQNRKAQVTKAVLKILNVKNRLILTGTPFLKILNIYSQMMFLKREFWKTNYWGWFNTYVNFIEEEVYVQGRAVRFKKVLGPHKEMMPQLLSRLRNEGHIIFTEDVNGHALLPKQSIMPLGVNIEDDLFEEYNLFKNDLIDHVGSVENSIHQAAKLIKLQQILAGCHLEKDSNKLKMLYNTIENEVDTDATPVLIWCRYKATMKMLSEKLTKKYKKTLKVFCINGETKKNDRREIFDYVNKHANCLVLIQIQVGRFGLDFKSVSVDIFYEMDFSLMNFNQAKARIRRLSSKGSSINYIIYYKATVDQHIYSGLIDGLKEADLIRSIYKKLIS